MDGVFRMDKFLAKKDVISHSATRLVGKGKGTYTWYSASSWIITSEALRCGTCSHGFTCTCTPTLICSRNEPYLHFAFSAIAGTHLPTLEGWKAELAWVAGYVVRQFTCPKAVTHPSTNRAYLLFTYLLLLTFSLYKAPSGEAINGPLGPLMAPHLLTYSLLAYFLLTFSLYKAPSGEAIDGSPFTYLQFTYLLFTYFIFV